MNTICRVCGRSCEYDHKQGGVGYGTDLCGPFCDGKEQGQKRRDAEIDALRAERDALLARLESAQTENDALLAILAEQQGILIDGKYHVFQRGAVRHVNLRHVRDWWTEWLPLGTVDGKPVEYPTVAAAIEAVNKHREGKQ